MSDGFITSIKRILLEDAGLSSDGVAANNAGGGQVDGIGVGPRGEPGGAAHRKRKRDALKSRSDRRLHKALTAESGVVELDLLSYPGQRRFAESKTGPIDDAPTIDTDAADRDRDPNPKKKSKTPSKRSLKRGPDASIEINPILPTRFESVVSESHKRPKRSTQRCDFLVKMGLGDIEHLTWYRNALQQPSLCVNNSTYRPVVAEVLDQLLDLIFADSVLYNRLRMQLLQNREREQSEEVDDDPHELDRFARWKAARVNEAFPSHSTAELGHMMASCADPGRRARIEQELKRRTGHRVKHTQLRVGAGR